ncbi:MAG: LLM class flavin-dependent oxidoreductase [Candidatus Microthrix sp.]|nr:LLM class flavin-dependent oxidoreductase [Candidatus Microthrix sp.]MBK9560115.1 LLM class flavin-dependent oxidoreductase [Candidatus Microthrix sp.]
MTQRSDAPAVPLEVGAALPTMARGWSRSTLVDWCDLIDDGPFSSISCGERITFHNTEMLTTMGAAAGRCDRVRVLLNLAVGPWHHTALLAKQVATLDVITDGRVELGLGVGGRPQDFEALGVDWSYRHQRLDDQVAELRRWWAGDSVLDGAPPLGPPPVQPGGPPLYSGAMGPKATARAARWADGISWFDLSLDATEVTAAAGRAADAWADAGREGRPHLKVACFVALGEGSTPTLRSFTENYLAIFGRRFAADTAATATLDDPSALTDALLGLADTGVVDEVILVPATVDPRCGELMANVVGALAPAR